MRVHCKYCLPKEGIDLPNFTESDKQRLWQLKFQPPLFAVKELMTVDKMTHRDAKYVVMHINETCGHCNRCSSKDLKGEYINCPTCGALNFNWQVSS
jgi:hypothetical protein